MKTGALEKIKHLMGLDESEFEEDYEYEDENFYESLDEQEETRKTNGKVVSLHTNVNMKIVVREPLNYEEAPEMVNDLRSRKTVVMNLEELERETKNQIFDFMNGAIYSLDGSIQKVTKDIFVLAPKSVEIDGLKEDLKNKGIYHWER